MSSAYSHQSNSFDSDRLSHAYIVAGNPADTLAMAVVCSGNRKKPCMNCTHCDKASRGAHPDIMHVYKPENKREIVIEQIRALKKDVIIVPNEAEKKAYIINDADLMNVNAQNAFLRILEEPPAHAVFILKTGAPAQLLTTVRSRCVELKSGIEEKRPDDDITDMVSAFFHALESGNASLAAFMFRLETLDKGQFSEFLTAARKKTALGLRAGEFSCHEALHGSISRKEQSEALNAEILSRVEQILMKANDYLDLNVGLGHISGMLCASLIS